MANTHRHRPTWQAVMLPLAADRRSQADTNHNPAKGLTKTLCTPQLESTLGPSFLKPILFKSASFKEIIASDFHMC